MITFICLQQNQMGFGLWFCWVFFRLYWPVILHGYFIAEVQLAEVSRALTNTDEKNKEMQANTMARQPFYFYLMTVNLFLCTNQLENSYI